MNADVERAMNWLKGMADDRGYTKHLAHGGKGDPIEEQEIERASTALKYIESLQAQLKLEHGGALAAAENCLRLQGEVNDLQAQLAKEKRRAEKAIARIKAFDEMGWFCRWRDGGACTINGKREICRKGTVNGTKNPCRDWQWRGDAEEYADRAIEGLDEVLPPKGRVRDERG